MHVRMSILYGVSQCMLHALSYTVDVMCCSVMCYSSIAMQLYMHTAVCNAVLGELVDKILHISFFSLLQQFIVL